MSNLTLGWSLIVFAILGTPVMLFSIFKKEENETAFWFTLLCLSNILWAVSNALVYLVQSEEAAKFLFDIRLVFVGTSSILIFMVVMKGFRKRQIDPKMLMCLFIFPALTVLVTIATRYFDIRLMDTSFEFTYTNSVRMAQVNYSIWFWAHCIFCYLLIASAAIALLRHFRRMPKEYRTPITIVLAAIILSFLTSAMAIFRVLPHGVDMAPYISVIMHVLFYFAVFNPQSVDNLVSSRDIIFDRSNHPLLVLNNDREIIDYNYHASKIGKEIGYSRMSGVNYDEFLEKWMEHTEGEVFEDDHSIFTVHEETGDTHYQLTSESLTRVNNSTIGSYVEIKNITPMMTLIHKLQDSAYFDNLTGLRNRNYQIQIMKDWDHDATMLPLGVMVGDLNKLKLINDRYGHAQGDMVLQKAAEILNGCKPPNSIVFRSGGDEFVVLAPNTEKAIMQTYLENVEEECRKLTESEGIMLSIALAYRLKDENASTIQSIINEADRAMYISKMDRRHT